MRSEKEIKELMSEYVDIVDDIRKEIINSDGNYDFSMFRSYCDYIAALEWVLNG